MYSKDYIIFEFYLFYLFFHFGSHAGKLNLLSLSMVTWGPQTWMKNNWPCSTNTVRHKNNNKTNCSFLFGLVKLHLASKTSFGQVVIPSYYLNGAGPLKRNFYDNCYTPSSYILSYLLVPGMDVECDWICKMLKPW